VRSTAIHTTEEILHEGEIVQMQSRSECWREINWKQTKQNDARLQQLVAPVRQWES